jgi:hypothetical protein
METGWTEEPKDRPAFSKIIPMMDEIIVEVSIDDAIGRDFWKTCFFNDVF